MVNILPFHAMRSKKYPIPNWIWVPFACLSLEIAYDDSMLKTKRDEKSDKPAELKVKVASHIVHDLKRMEEVTHRSVDDLVQTALKMFIATHNDFLGKRNPQ